MLFSKTLVIPAATSAESPLSDSIKVAAGTIRALMVRFRYGSAYLCGVRLLHGSHALLPRNLGEWLPSSAYPYQTIEEYTISSDLTEITILAYNEDVAFEHRVWIGVDMTTSEVTPRLAEFVNWLASSTRRR